jgi:hypothetical protein
VSSSSSSISLLLLLPPHGAELERAAVADHAEDDAGLEYRHAEQTARRVSSEVRITLRNENEHEDETRITSTHTSVSEPHSASRAPATM